MTGNHSNPARLHQNPKPFRNGHIRDDAAERMLMIWRHRFVPDRWTWELPGGYLDVGEDPVVMAVREVQEETGWRPGA